MTMTEPSCKTCRHHIISEDGKLACTYGGLCHTPTGEKSAYHPDKATEYAELVGLKVRPSLHSPIDYFEIRGYDAERDMVLTIAHPRHGYPFDDEIEDRRLINAFEVGEYEVLKGTTFPVDEQNFVIIAKPDPNMFSPVRKQKFFGPSCDRCQHRFGTTSNRDWCHANWQKEKCYRFKLEK